MKSIKRALFTFMLAVFGLPNLFIFNVTLAQSPYDAVLSTTISGPWLQSATSYEWDIVDDASWWKLVNDQIKKLIWYAIDVFIIIGIAIAFFGWYSVMTSDSEDKTKEWIRLVIFGILWIIIMMSAKFLAESLVWTSGIISLEFNKAGDNTDPNWITLAKNLYEKILYPFIKVALYLVTWALFFIMASKVISFVISTDETAKKKAWWIILWCVIWILIIMWSKQIVEAIMWKQESVLNEAATKLMGWDTWIAEDVLDFNSIPIIAQVINWVMWLTMFVILVLIIIQGYKMFAKPDDPKNRESLKKTLLYILIWVLVIGASYVISNLLVLNWFSPSQLNQS